MFNWFKSNDKCNSQVLKTREDKLIEKENQEMKMICPNCGMHPEGGKYHFGIVLGTTDGTYSYVTCTHCDCDYRYKG